MQRSNNHICIASFFIFISAEENEINFDPGDVISNIEMIDEGWWIGTGPDGAHGMFPANYVEILNNAQITKQ